MTKPTQNAAIVGIVGAGLIGRSWANVFARAASTTSLWFERRVSRS
jgi:3-hydroxyacyl-CoA dehydrogenase